MGLGRPFVFYKFIFFISIATCVIESHALASGALRPQPNVGLDRVLEELVGDCQNANNPVTQHDMECKHAQRVILLDIMNGCMPLPSEVFNAYAYRPPQVPSLPLYILGLLNDKFRMDYRYSMYGGGSYAPGVQVSLYLEGPGFDDPGAGASIDAKLRGAEAIWQNESPVTNLRFNFARAPTAARSHFAVNYVSGPSRGPYMWTWSAQWTEKTFAHELGHMMGLHDEYAEFDQRHPERHCRTDSLMCDSWNGKPLKYHYYAILRRAFCTGR